MRHAPVWSEEGFGSSKLAELDYARGHRPRPGARGPVTKLEGTTYRYLGVGPKTTFLDVLDHGESEYAKIWKSKIFGLGIAKNG